MFTSNPFATLSATIPPSEVIQVYVGRHDCAWWWAAPCSTSGTRGAPLISSASWRSARGKGDAAGRRRDDTSHSRFGPVWSEVLTSAEFGLGRRRVAHPADDVRLPALCRDPPSSWCSATRRPNRPRPPSLPQLWIAGALLICLGGYWFWFFIRVDVVGRGPYAPFRIMRADLFVLSLLASASLGLIWAALQSIDSCRDEHRCSCSTSLPRPCCSAPFRGPSSRTCSSSRRRPSRSGCPRRPVRGATCRRLPTSLQPLGIARASGRATTDRPTTGLRKRRVTEPPCRLSST